MITKKFVRNSIIYTVAGSLPMASGIILLPFYTTYLSTTLFGTLAVYLGFSMLIQILTTYNFDNSVYVYYHDFKHNEAQLSRYISSSFTFILIVSFIVSIVLSLAGIWLFKLIPTDSELQFYPYGFISALTGMLQGIIKVNSTLLQTQEKASSFLWMNLGLFSLIAFCTIIGMIIFPNSLLGPIGGRMIAVLIIGAWVLFSIYQQFGYRFDFHFLRETFDFNHPALLYQILQWFNSYFDRWMMAFYLPLSQIGIYDLAARCLSVIDFASSGLYNTFLPKVLGQISLQKEKHSTIEVNRYYNGLTSVILFMVVATIFGFPIVFNWLVNCLIVRKEYLQTIYLIPMIGVTYLLRSLRYYIAMPYSALKFNKPLPFFYLIIATSKIISMIILIPKFGIQGVIMATWMSYFVEIVILYFGIQKKFIFRFNWSKLVYLPLSTIAILLVVEPICGKQWPTLTHGFYVLYGLTMILIVYRGELKYLNFHMK